MFFTISAMIIKSLDRKFKIKSWVGTPGGIAFEVLSSTAGITSHFIEVRSIRSTPNDMNVESSIEIGASLLQYNGPSSDWNANLYGVKDGKPGDSSKILRVGSGPGPARIRVKKLVVQDGFGPFDVDADVVHDLQIQ
jgi:hypothetical protein